MRDIAFASEEDKKKPAMCKIFSLANELIANFDWQKPQTPGVYEVFVGTQHA